VVSQIVMKLLAKAAEDRYQSAAGLESDLRRCLAAWEANRRIGAFALGDHDVPDRLFIPEKLYGRARELEILLAAFDRVVKGGAPEFVLVTGYSGVGKSAVVNELHKELVPPRGLFAAGKFDQYKRDIPYSTLVQAFQSLVRQLLGKSNAELTNWRDALSERSPNDRPRPGTEAHNRRPAAGPGARAAAGTNPFSARVPPVHRRLRPAGAPAGVIPRRSAMARRGDARHA
jgi:hypothetical protein